MAYNKAFNPDALPAHAEPEQAAQALGQLQGNRRPSPNIWNPNHQPLNSHAPRPSSPGIRRTSPAGISTLNTHRASPVQPYFPHRSPNSQSYGDNHFSRLPSPPSQVNYGYSPGPRPQTEPAGPRRPSNEGHQYPARTPALPDPGSVDLLPLFRAANVSGTGSLTTAELGSALVNADFTPFDSLTITSLMRMFSTSPPNQPQGLMITFTEFDSLWQFLAAWRTLFERFDEDRSGRLSLGEFSKAMTAFGYRLSQPFIGVLYHAFNDRSPVPQQGMSFDLFVQACISLRRMTDVFKKYDDDRDGYVTLSFEEFLTEILRLRD